MRVSVQLPRHGPVPYDADVQSPLFDRDRAHPLVLDGGLATELERRGNDLSDRLWSARLLADAPDEIAEVHLSFFRAGAQVVTSASYQASFEGFEASGLDQDEAAALMRRSIELAAGARDRFRAEATADGRDPGPLRVAASVGPYGAVLADGSEYRGDDGLTTEQLAGWHRARLAVLASAEPDLLACETIPSVREGAALVGLLTEADGPPAWLSYTCADGATTRSGESVEAAFALADRAERVVAVGVNCTDPRFLDELIERARATTGKPIVVYPNRGGAWDAEGRRWVSTQEMRVDGEAARRWVTEGAMLVGGCCRVTPEDIAAIAQAVGRSGDPSPRDDEPGRGPSTRV